MQKANQKKARNALQNSIQQAPTHGEGLKHSIENIENAIKVCMKQDIRSTDNQIVTAKSKLELLKIKNGKRFKNHWE